MEKKQTFSVLLRNFYQLQLTTNFFRIKMVLISVFPFGWLKLLNEICRRINRRVNNIYIYIFFY